MRIFFLKILLLGTVSCYCQLNKEFEFIGTLQTSDGVIITYKLNFKETSDGVIEGVSITDFYGENNTKTRITGFYNKGEKKLSFNEIENISTKSTSDINEFCFIRVKNAKIKSIKGKSIIQGNFKGFFLNDSSCVNGYLYLLGTDFLEQLSDQIISTDPSKNDTNTITAKQRGLDLLKKSGENHLHANDILKLNWKSDEVILEIWDSETIDQDMITIIINEKKIVENFVIKKDKKIIVLPFVEKVCTIKIIAVNEGASPPNTVSAVFKDGSLLTPFVASLKKGETASIVLQKK